MSDPDRVSLAFIWDTASPHFSRRTFMRTMAFASAAGFVAACGSSSKSGTGSTGTTASGGRRRRRRSRARPRPRRSTSTTGPTTSPTTRSRTSKRKRDQGHLRQLQLERRALREDAHGRHGLRHHRPDRRDAREDEAREPLAAARSLADPERRRTSIPRFRTAAYDPGNQYSIPWQWGTTGIGYDKTKVGGSVTDWDAFQLPGVAGKSSFLDEARDAFAMALFALKKDPNTLDTGDLDAAEQYLIDLKKKVKKITSDYQDPLKSGELVLCAGVLGRRLHDPGRQREHRIRHPHVGRAVVGRLDGDPEGRRAPEERRGVHELHPRAQGRRRAHELRELRQPQQGRRAVHQQGHPRQPADLPAAGRCSPSSRSRRTSARTSSSTRTAGTR